MLIRKRSLVEYKNSREVDIVQAYLNETGYWCRGSKIKTLEYWQIVCLFYAAFQKIILVLTEKL